MNTVTTNRPQLETIRNLPIGEIAQLPAEHLALLQEDAAAALDSSKKAKDWIEAAIALRFSEQAQAVRREAGKDTGTVRFDSDGVTVVADLPKRVDWDQALIADLVERIRAGGDDPGQYVEIAIKVPERKYTAWPDHIRRQFEPARTVRTGKPSISLHLGEHGQ